jgi:hypothetical protein
MDSSFLFNFTFILLTGILMSNFRMIKLQILPNMHRVIVQSELGDLSSSAAKHYRAKAHNISRRTKKLFSQI